MQVKLLIQGLEIFPSWQITQVTIFPSIYLYICNIFSILLQIMILFFHIMNKLIILRENCVSFKKTFLM